MVLVTVSLSEGSWDLELRCSGLLYNLQSIHRIWTKLQQGSLYLEQNYHTVLLKALLKVVFFIFWLRSAAVVQIQVSFYDLISECPPVTEIKAMSVLLVMDG